MQSTIIELSRYTSDDKPSNAEWTNRLVKNVTLDDGDYIMIKQAFIDTRQIDQNSILIDNDVNWTFRFVYWVQGHSINQYTVFQNFTSQPFTPDGLPYILCDARSSTDPIRPILRGKPVVDTFNIFIPKGTYERPAFAEFITRQLQTIGQPQNFTYTQNYFTRSITVPTYDSNNNFTGFRDTTSENPNNFVTSFSKPLFYGEWIQEGAVPLRKQLMFYKDINNVYRGAVYHKMTNAFNYGVGTADSLVTIVNYSSTGSGSINQINNVYQTSSFNIWDGSVIGASQMSFVYNDNGGNGRFSFQYMHSPLITGGTNGGNEVVGTFVKAVDEEQSDTNIISYLNAYSGIMLVDTFTDGDTTAFLNQLGFNRSDLIPPDVATVFAFNNNCMDDPTNFQTFDYNNTFLKYTTRNVMTMGEVTSDLAVTVGNTQIVRYQSVYCQEVEAGKTTYTFSDSQTTEELVATEPPISSNTNAGHYLIELQNVHNSNYINQDKFYNIKAVIGNYFLSGDSFTQSMGPDSYIYQHKGQPLPLSSIKIRILNPVTKEASEDIGPNSTVYLQVTREKEPIPQEQPKEEKK
jgi:hypothetical protein